MNALLDRITTYIIDLIYPKGKLVKLIQSFDSETFLNNTMRASVELSASFPIYSLFSYKDPIVRTSIKEVKYKNNRKIASLFARILEQQMKIELEDEIIYSNFLDPLIIPIPSHREKKKAKGFNQTEVIIDLLSQISEVECLNALNKDIQNGEQTKKDRESRLSDMVGCFSVKKEFALLVCNRNVIIFDDVVTTGGTLTEAHRVLKKAGARRIVGFTLAH